MTTESKQLRNQIIGIVAAAVISNGIISFITSYKVSSHDHYRIEQIENHVKDKVDMSSFNAGITILKDQISVQKDMIQAIREDNIQKYTELNDRYDRLEDRFDREMARYNVKRGAETQSSQ